MISGAYSKRPGGQRRLKRAGALFVLLALAPASFPQQPGTSPLPQLLEGMRSPNWQQREKAFYALLALGGQRSEPPQALANVAQAYPGEFPSAARAIIASLQQANGVEADYEREGKHFPNEEFGDYVATLIWAVGALHDPSALPALLPQIGSGQGAIQAIASLGPHSLPVLLQLTGGPSPPRSTSAWVVRVSATAALAAMAEARNRARLDRPDLKKLHSALVRAAEQPDFSQRLWGIRGLSALGDPSEIPLLESLGRKYANTRDEVNAALKSIHGADIRMDAAEPPGAVDVGQVDHKRAKTTRTWNGAWAIATLTPLRSGRPRTVSAGNARRPPLEAAPRPDFSCDPAASSRSRQRSLKRTGVLFTLLTLAPAGLAQEHGTSPLPQLLDRMRSPSWQTREKAFFALLALGGPRSEPPQALANVAHAYPREFPGAAHAIIASLQQANDVEADYEREGKHFPNEEFDDYVATLIWAVGALHDPAAVPALLGQINSGEGAGQALASLGEASLPALLRLAGAPERSQGSDAWLTRTSAVATLADMAQPENRGRLAPASVRKLRASLVRAASANDRAMRVFAIRGLGALGDPSEVPFLEDLGKKYANTRDEVNAALKRIHRDEHPDGRG